ncbi:ribonuclease mrp protein subunit snm1 [Anaeramoeba flamelloides]|uniref:Ribonuclease mrp protein subunit snm1 n=1 Tax=Anaeramoeba flamelloides TaxID=1746091 RepID=A0AAV8A2E2_9EUKA|nr:ribonuclease mrp protein subunit snm1 [Anaeramoeba flamelloides]
MGNKFTTPTKTLLTIKSKKIKGFLNLVSNSNLCLAIVDLDLRIKLLNQPYSDALQLPNTQQINDKSHKELLESKESIFAPYQPYYKTETMEVMKGAFAEAMNNYTADIIFTYQRHRPTVHYFHAKLDLRKIRIGKEFFFFFKLVKLKENPKTTPDIIKNSDQIKKLKKNKKKNKNKNRNKNKNNSQNKDKNKNKNKNNKLVRRKKNKKLKVVSWCQTISDSEESDCSYIEEI